MSARSVFEVRSQVVRLVASGQNETLKYFQSLQSKKELRHRRRSVLVEGAHVVKELLRHPNARIKKIICFPENHAALFPRTGEPSMHELTNAVDHVWSMLGRPDHSMFQKFPTFFLSQPASKRLELSQHSQKDSNILAEISMPVDMFTQHDRAADVISSGDSAAHTPEEVGATNESDSRLFSLMTPGSHILVMDSLRGNSALLSLDHPGSHFA